jgi:dimeric dUTPase (all-alpha-NTP-PPase superfamily)
MNLIKLFEMQKILRQRINYNEPDRFNKLILALLVELGECANEWRGFKFWSKDQKPAKILHTTQGATPENAVYFKCMSEDDCGEYSYKDDFTSLLEEPDYEVCPKCHEGYTYTFREKNPLLEEYVDGLHFVLELGIELDFAHIVKDLKPTKNESITDQFIFISAKAGTLLTYHSIPNYLHIVQNYIGLGEMLGFTWEEIEQAYISKNQVNHQRQNNGY